MRLQCLLLSIALTGSCAASSTSTRPIKPTDGHAANANNENSMDVAMVLLREPTTLTPDALQTAYSALGGETLTDIESRDHSIAFNLSAGVGAIAIVAAPIPADELTPVAETALLWPEALSATASHHAHAIVTVAHRTGSQVDRKLRLTRLTAAVAEATGAIGVYWGEAPALHSREFFTASAQAASVEHPPLDLWLGLSVADADNGQVSLLTRGMEEFGYPNLLLEGPRDNATIAFVYDLASYIVTRNATLSDGDTVGHSPSQRIVVRHKASPIDANATVYAIDLPSDFAQQQ